MANTTRERNYRKHPHTASFLQTFHTAMTEAERMTASENDEQAALDFISEPKVTIPGTGGRVKAYAPARNDGSYLVEIEGHTVRCGGPNVTEKQAKWIIDIATTRVTPEGRTAESVLVRLEQGMAKFAGSQFITTYKDLPRKGAEVTVTVEPVEQSSADKRDAQGVPEGRYAVEEDGTLKFFRITKGKGRWAGRTFVEIQASDDRYAVRNPARRDAILATIAEDLDGAARRYGQELGHCYRCGRTLTDAVSRDLGIGPDCRAK